MERQRKRKLRDLNARAWAGDKDVLGVDGSLDSSMKKNTAFIRRLRTAISASGTSIFIQEIRTLSLHKYLSEITSATFEGLSKLKLPADIAAGIDVFSALHQRFGPQEFTGYVGWLIGRGLSSPDKALVKTWSQEAREKEEKERIARHRVLLRIATELWLVGALRSLEDVVRPEEVGKAKENMKPSAPPAHKIGVNGLAGSNADAEPFPLEVLKELTAQDSHHVNLPMIASFTKTFSWDLLGKKISDDEATQDEGESLVDAAMQQRFKNVLEKYFQGAIAHLLKDQELLNNQSRRNAEAYVRSGEIFEDRQANYERQVKAQERFVSNMQILADALSQDMPDLKEKDSSAATGDGSIGLVKTGEYLRGEGDGSGIWEDEEERRFYENLVDLKDRVPLILLEEPKKKKVDGDDQVGRKADDKTTKTGEDGIKVEKTDIKDQEANDQSTAIANKTVGAQVDAILARLPDVTSKEAIDEIAYDFCFVNSKASRNRLIKAVQEIPKGRSDLLPLYSRLVTTLGKYMPDVSQGLVSYLDEEFRSLQRRKQKDSLGGIRTSNIRYLAELTKFGLVPEHVIFHCLKVSLDEFSKMNIEIICNLLENCGRYLVRNPETSPRMKSFLETLQRKKTAQHLGQQERMLIENAIYYVNPPERAAIQQKEKTPIDLFVRKLIYVDLTKRNLEKVAKQIRKLHWEEEEVVHVIHKILVKPGNIKYSNIHFLACILFALNRYHQELTISVIDDLLENITLGLELNDFKFNQRRIAEVKYLAELYVYRMIDSSIIFDTMFKILTFGHGGFPKPGNYCALDAPDDFFRIRLICTVLETCGMYYDKGAAKKKLDFFLTFFQYYVQVKDPLPMDVEFVLQDAYALLRPQWKLATDLEQAGTAFAEACKENYASAASGKSAGIADQDDSDELDEEREEGGRRTPDGQDDDASSADEAELKDEEIPETLESDLDDEEHITVTRPEDERDPEAEADFDRELAKLMSESLETRKTERRPMFDVALPMRRAQRDTVAVAQEADEPHVASLPNTIKFSLLSKKGNRPQTRAIDLPADSNFAVAMRTQQEAERAEQQRIKKLVLNYDYRNDNNNDDDHAAVNGDSPPSYILHPNPNHLHPLGTLRRREYIPIHEPVTETLGVFLGSAVPVPQRAPMRDFANDVIEKKTVNHDTGNAPKQNAGHSIRGGSRRNHQPRKLQLSDVDWYVPTTITSRAHK